jgi:hypothetical protein
LASSFFLRGRGSSIRPIDAQETLRDVWNWSELSTMTLRC